MFHKAAKTNRKGAILVLAAVLMVVLFSFMAFSVDLGYLSLARTELQRSADSAAIAATWDLVNANDAPGQTDPRTAAQIARTTAAAYVLRNVSGGAKVALAQDDAIVGRLATSTGGYTVQEDASTLGNSVQVRIRRTADQNGEIPLFFARVLGINSHSLEAVATAAFTDNIAGFRLPADAVGINVNLLPFALDKETWDAMLHGIGPDQWTWDPETNLVQPGTDSILEVNLYPQGTGSPGNRGTVDIGNPNNSTKDLSRQIRDGISGKDLEYMGGKVELNAQGELCLHADTGISAGVKDDLASIIGKPRMLPIFSKVSGNGNNAMYTIVQFVGVRLLEVKLTGSMSGKRVMVQAANVTAVGGIPAPLGSEPTSMFIHSPVHLVQ